MLVRENLYENLESIDNDINILKNIAKQFDDPYKFSDYLNRNKFGHNREYSFLGERFNRLNRGTRLIGNEIITIYRTGETPIVWGDYVYIDYNDALHAKQSGQGNKVYRKNVKKSDIIETSVSDEYYYSPKKIAKLGDDLVEFWFYVNNKNIHKKNDNDNIKQRIDLFNSELRNMKNKYDNFEDFEYDAYNLSLKYKVPFENYEKWF